MHRVLNGEDVFELSGANLATPKFGSALSVSWGRDLPFPNCVSFSRRVSQLSYGGVFGASNSCSRPGVSALRRAIPSFAGRSDLAGGPTPSFRMISAGGRKAASAIAARAAKKNVRNSQSNEFALITMSEQRRCQAASKKEVVHG